MPLNQNYHLGIPFCSSKIKVLLLLDAIRLKIELDRLRLLFIEPPLCSEEFEFVLDLPKTEIKFRKALRIPFPLARCVLVSHVILLGLPEPSPSTSVYTTGSSLSPPLVLLPPVNLPTANPPPGNLQIVSPTAADSSSFVSLRCTDTDLTVRDSRDSVIVTESVESVGSSCRHTGHEFRNVSHGRIQSEW
ncbi:hypothetical protein HanRHA438_Chr08g0372681 [Helianthus annuus]|nr:hypothetical protein HanIR_Chr08g0389481 [Helianthus annuus]KAJ0899796.1 hypothetical protein HanRHA438_Chr08g0372681 [Helianthus annuus]